ncbi:MAG: hypothetical protein KC589_02255 [Nanoarchaeota archaeon]|nr:hypothetical protein [Nanoarchaeota archaeon]
MKSKEKKQIQLEYAKKNINFFFKLLDSRFRPDFDKYYIKEIKNISSSFNIRLSREQKLKFCKNCNIYWNTQTRIIRLNSNKKTKEYICKNCNFKRNFIYSSSSSSSKTSSSSSSPSSK